MSKLSPPVQAIVLMLFAMAGFSAMNIVIRILSHDMPSTQMVFLRNIASLMIVCFWTGLLRQRWIHYPTARLSSHFWRASIGIVAMELWFHAVSLLPVTLVTALSFTTPIFSTLIAISFLGEKAGIRRWSAIACGFIGVLIILRPGISDMSSNALFVIGSSLMMGVAGVMVKTLSRTEPPETIVFYMALFMIPWSLPLAAANWQAVTLHQLWLVFWIGFFSTASHLLMARAYQRVDLVMLMPFDFSRLIFTALFAYALFGETIDGPTIAGSLLILASSVYIARREAILRRSAL